MTGLAFTYVNDRWVAGNPPLVGPMSHALWMSSVVFDGARAFEGVAPDLDGHCARVLRSASIMGLEPKLNAGELVEIALDGLRLFEPGAALYIRPIIFADEGFVVPEPSSTRLVVTLFELPMPSADGFTACLSTRVRPLPASALTEAKAACLYPNVAQMLREARSGSFDSAVVLDPLGNIAEFAIANLFLARHGVVHTPIINGTFLDGITRQRVIKLLRDAAIKVVERTLTLADLANADEVFSTGNYGKVVPLTKFGAREFEPGPLGRLARRLYWDFAHA
ncbi:MAG: branched-chain amino acid aminotransferase [Rhodospirillaceae bacterium]